MLREAKRRMPYIGKRMGIGWRFWKGGRGGRYVAGSKGRKKRREKKSGKKESERNNWTNIHLYLSTKMVFV